MSDEEISGRDPAHTWRTKSICRHMLYEGCDLQGKLKSVGTIYKIHLDRRNFKNFSNDGFREHALEIMFEFYDYFSKDIDIWPMFGTLLGMIRDDDLIKHDEDVDFGYFKKDEHKVIQKLDYLHNTNGYKLIRNEFSNLYSVVKEDVFIDLYEYENLPESDFLQQGHRSFYNLKKDEMFPMKTINFKQKNFKCINKPIKFFERYYGKDWQQPK
tara:strand:- start:19914 stop:20552 length:639 start_codon:yes stop_codon:yes gene_type:complete